MIMFIIAIILMIPFVVIKALEFVKWFMDDPQEAFYEGFPQIAFIIGLIIYFSELITCRT